MSDDKNDLTRIEDLSEFVHQLDNDLDSQLDDGGSKGSLPATPVDIDTLDEQESSFSDDFSSTDIEISDLTEPTEPDFQLSSSDLDIVDSSETEEVPFASSIDDFATSSEFNTEEDLNTTDDDFSSPPIEEDEVVIEEVLTVPTSSTQPPPPISPPETFKDIRQFAHNISYGQVTRAGNPPFTLLIRDISYTDDIEDIKIILTEYGLYTDENKQLVDKSLSNGSLILPQLSEFSAIFLANKLRRFSGDIQLGLSEEIHPSKGVNKQFKGLISKENLLRNTHAGKNLQREQFSINSILLTTTPTIHGQEIRDYLGITTADIIVPEKFFKNDGIHSSNTTSEVHDILENFTIGSSSFYHELIEKIKLQAYELGANGVVGVTYIVTPLIQLENSEKTATNYKIIATGSAVFIQQIAITETKN